MKTGTRTYRSNPDHPKASFVRARGQELLLVDPKHGEPKDLCCAAEPGKVRREQAGRSGSGPRGMRESGVEVSFECGLGRGRGRLSAFDNVVHFEILDLRRT